MTVEFINTTFDECFLEGQIIEVGGIGDVIDSATHFNTDNREESLVPDTSSQIPETEHDDVVEVSVGDEKTVDRTEINDSIESDFSSSDEEGIVELPSVVADTSHIPPGFPKYFQDSLFWPGEKPEDSSEGSKRKRKKKEKVPAVLIAKDFVDYLKNKEEEKRRLEEEKCERKKQKELRKLEKQKQEEEKQQMVLERKIETKRKNEEKEKLKVERQLVREARKIEKQKNHLDKEAKNSRKKEAKSTKSRKMAALVDVA